MRTFAQKPKGTQKTTSKNSTKSSRSFLGQSRNVGAIFHLQRTIGNQVFLRLMQSKAENISASSVTSKSTDFAHDFSRMPVYPGTINSIQPKLKVSAAGDRYEQEADRIADEVLRQRIPKGDDKELDIQVRASQKEASGDREVNEELENRLHDSKGSGIPISDQVRAFVEPRMQFDFSRVQVHTDNEAARMSQELGARAFTHGQDIYFSVGQYNPQSVEGKRLLIHELTHVVQQHHNRSAFNSAQVLLSPDLRFGRRTRTLRVRWHEDYDIFRRRVRTLAIRRLDVPAVWVDQLLHVRYAGDLRSTFENLSRADPLRSSGAAVLIKADYNALRSVGPSSLRFTVVHTPPTGVQTSPQLTAAPHRGPIAGNCGGAFSQISWELSGNSGANGGYVIQHITFSWNRNDCTGSPVPLSPSLPSLQSPLSYFEAWRVLPNSRNFDTADTNLDGFFLPRPQPPTGTNGRMEINATARYHDNVSVAAMPAHMIRNNQATGARTLRSSLTNPNLGGSISQPVPHRLVFHWTCCPPSQTNATVIDGHTP